MEFWKYLLEMFKCNIHKNQSFLLIIRVEKKENCEQVQVQFLIKTPIFLIYKQSYKVD